MTEIWKSLEGYDGYYISNIGQIRGPRGILAQQFNHAGRYQVVIRNNTLLVHREVCQAFNGPPPKDKPWALHKNDICTDNVSDNLYWGTPQDNMDDRERNGNTPKGETHPRARLTWDKVREIRRRYHELRETQHSLAIAFGTSGANISAIVYNRSWKE